MFYLLRTRRSENVYLSIKCKKSEYIESDGLVALDSGELKIFNCHLSCTDFSRPMGKVNTEIEYCFTQPKCNVRKTMNIVPDI